MKCKEAENKIIFYLEQDLSQDEMTFMHEHLKSCSSCKEKADAMSAVLFAVESQKITGQDPFFYTRLRQKLTSVNETEKGFLSKSLVPVAQVMLVAASLVIGLFIGLNKETVSYTREEALESFADDYYLFETRYDPIETIMFTENEE